MKIEKPYLIEEIKSSKTDEIYYVHHYETFYTCTCPWFKARWTCKHIKPKFIDFNKWTSLNLKSINDKCEWIFTF